MSGEKQTQQLVVDLSCNTGALKYGASGFLYGLGNANIPTVNVLAPLKPQVAAQKPEGGLQHPNGDAFQVAGTFKEAGGREIQVYLQDMYADWPYENRGIADYLNKVEQMTHEIVAHPNRTLFSYVPLNEPDQIWYNKTDKKQELFKDWKKICRAIRALDVEARIVGPNFAQYDGNVYREFLEFARDNACLPDVVSWHELDDSFFTHWYTRHDEYRSIERELGVAPRELCINEYARKEGDLGVPGKLVQWIARFENSKVDACLAYWTSAGCLNDLIARDTDNQATGGWWLYQWYGSMTGHTVLVKPTDANVEGLQGLACFDAVRMQVRVLFGGGSGRVEVALQGLETATFLSKTVKVLVWETRATGFDPFAGPTLVLQGRYDVTNNQVTIPLEGMLQTSAYQIIISPASDTRVAPFSGGDWYPVENADLSADGTRSFIVTAGEDGFYTVRAFYKAEGAQDAGATCTSRIVLNGEPLAVGAVSTSSVPNAAEASFQVFLRAGINHIAFQSAGDSAEESLKLDSFVLARGSGAAQYYEAEALNNTLGGTARVMENPRASGGNYVGNIGNGEGNYLQFNSIQAEIEGNYLMVVTFANAEFRGAHNYNSQIVDGHADIQVNDALPVRVWFRNTFTWNAFRTTVVRIRLRAGENSIRFSNNTANAPNIDRIQIVRLELAA